MTAKGKINLHKLTQRANQLNLSLCSDGWAHGLPVFKLCRRDRKGREVLLSHYMWGRLTLIEVEEILDKLERKEMP